MVRPSFHVQHLKLYSPIHLAPYVNTPFQNPSGRVSATSGPLHILHRSAILILAWLTPPLALLKGPGVHLPRKELAGWNYVSRAMRSIVEFMARSTPQRRPLQCPASTPEFGDSVSSAPGPPSVIESDNYMEEEGGESESSVIDFLVDGTP